MSEWTVTMILALVSLLAVSLNVYFAFRLRREDRRSQIEYQRIYALYETIIQERLELLRLRSGPAFDRLDRQRDYIPNEGPSQLLERLTSEVYSAAAEASRAENERFLEALNSRLREEQSDLRTANVMAADQALERVARLETTLGQLLERDHSQATESVAKLQAITQEVTELRKTLEADRAQQPTGFVERVVFFGTDRAPAKEPVYYGTDRSDLHLGYCVVTVPEKRKTGTIPRPGLWRSEDRERHYILHSVNEQTEAEFIEQLRHTVQQDSDKQALVFVHGFNVTFVDAVYRTAQIAADLDFAGAAAVFSWPSASELSRKGYVFDMEQADYAVAHLPAFLRLIANNSDASTVHVIAHSMGNRLLTNAIRMALIHDKPAIKFCELMLTAPDIDADIFVDQIAPAITRAARRTTLYVSKHDRALHLSHSFRPAPRAGDCSEDIVVLDGIETVDVSEVSTDFLGHSYYGDNRTVLSDIFGVIKGEPPGKRFGLKRLKAGVQHYWAFRP